MNSSLQDVAGRCVASLRELRESAGHWTGELSSSALSTATAVTAFAVMARQFPAGLSDESGDGRLIRCGLDWLARHANTDGGWGDTTRSVSNISTTLLCWSAFGAVEALSAEWTASHHETVRRAEEWVRGRAGDTDPESIRRVVLARYGKDRTFSVPILMTCGLGGRMGPPEEAWRYVLQLPFELAALPASWFGALRLPVVSYALPALIAIGQARHRHRPSANPLSRWIRNGARDRTLDLLGRIQPENGGFLEATPLTSFVAMSLASAGLAGHPVVGKCAAFLRDSVRADGSWPIDTNLATWVTTLSVNAISAGERSFHDLFPADAKAIREWLLARQFRAVHSYTNAAPGGWAWTDLPGGVPDADDTAGALLALRHLGPLDERTREAGRAGVNWLVNLQNGDGGIPTFCSGWGALPFDRSGPDLTAHALRAWLAWMDDLAPERVQRTGDAIRSGLRYLERTQRENGAWIPLWFGNEFEPAEENLTYGTANVVRALAPVVVARRRMEFDAAVERILAKGAAWLVFAQKPDGSWSGFRDGPSSIEETALAVEALAAIPSCGEFRLPVRTLEKAVARGLAWLAARVESGEWLEPAPIGFYFAKLWYWEKLYPLVFATAAFQRAAAQPGPMPRPAVARVEPTSADATWKASW